MNVRVLQVLFVLAILASCEAEKVNEAGGPYYHLTNFENTLGDPAGAVPVSQRLERKLIKQGTLGFNTEAPSKTREWLGNQVRRRGGFVAQESTSAYGNRTTFRLVVRIPAAQFDSLVNAIVEYAGELETKAIGTQDVTEEFIDVEARLTTKKELELRYHEILKQARTVDEILSIERELGTLRTDIESVEGRLRYLKDQVSLSTLVVEYSLITSASANFSDRFLESLSGGWRLLMDFALGLTYIWPFLILAGGALVVVRRIRKKKA
jgi:hypothetical protein